MVPPPHPSLGGPVSGTVSFVPRPHLLMMNRLSTTKKVLDSHQVAFFVKGWGLGTRLGIVGSFQSVQALSDQERLANQQVRMRF